MADEKTNQEAETPEEAHKRMQKAIKENTKGHVELVDGSSIPAQSVRVATLEVFTADGHMREVPGASLESTDLELLFGTREEAHMPTPHGGKKKRGKKSDEEK